VAAVGVKHPNSDEKLLTKKKRVKNQRLTDVNNRVEEKKGH